MEFLHSTYEKKRKKLDLKVKDIGSEKWTEFQIIPIEWITTISDLNLYSFKFDLSSFIQLYNNDFRNKLYFQYISENIAYVKKLYGVTKYNFILNMKQWEMSEQEINNNRTNKIKCY